MSRDAVLLWQASGPANSGGGLPGRSGRPPSPVCSEVDPSQVRDWSNVHGRNGSEEKVGGIARPPLDVSDVVGGRSTEVESLSSLGMVRATQGRQCPLVRGDLQVVREEVHSGSEAGEGKRVFAIPARVPLQCTMCHPLLVRQVDQ